MSVLKRFRIIPINSDGIKVLITAGIHGNEHSSIELAQRLYQIFSKGQWKLKNIKQVSIFNFINYDGIFSFTRQCNGIDLNRQFRQQRSQVLVVQKIKRLIKQYDVIIDLHSSQNSTQFFYLNPDSYVQSYIKYLKSCNIPYVVNTQQTNTIKTYAIANGKIGFTYQMNQAGQNIDNISVINSVLLIKRLLSNISQFRIYKSNYIAKSIYTLNADLTGKLKILTSVGKEVKKNQLLGYIIGLDKKINIYSPVDGKVIAFPAREKYVYINTPIIGIQPINQ